MPEAARINDDHVCPKVEPGPTPHKGGPILKGSGDVLIDAKPAARAGDAAFCAAGGPDKIAQGCGTVYINHKLAARKSDKTVHGGVITAGASSVVIGVKGDAVTVFAIEGEGEAGAAAGEVESEKDGDQPKPSPPKPEDPTKPDAPVITGPKPCSIAGLKVRCEHGRSATEGVLQVVADTTNEQSISHTLQLLGLTLGGAWSSGGSESITAEVVTESAAGGTRKQVALKSRYDEPSESDWVSAQTPTQLPLPAHPDKTLIPQGAPLIFHVHGRGCDAVAQRCRIEVMPNSRGKVSATKTPVKEDPLSETRGGIGPAIWEDVSKSYRNSLGPFTFDPPEGTTAGRISAEWGWKEREDSRASWEMALDFELTASVSMGLRFSLVHFAAMFFLPDPLVRLGRAAFGDAEVSLSGSLGVAYAPKRLSLFRDADGSFGAGMTHGGQVTGTGVLAGIVNVGNKYLLALRLKGGAKVSIVGNASVSLSNVGVSMTAKVERQPMKYFVECIVEGWFFNTDYSGEWQEMNSTPTTLWTMPGRTVWLFEDT